MPVSHHSARVAKDLDAVFTVPRMERVWRRAVRTGLRRQSLADLHDFLDVHRNLKPYLQALRSEVIGGQYRPLPPEITLLEKRDGIPRRLSLPAPGDAILLQTLVEVLEAAIASQQPHANAFYSQSHSPPTPEDVDGTFAYPWWILWPEFQQRIWKFANTFDYVVIADLANYFDCIPLLSLRNRLASFHAFSEHVLNFLFFMLDAFTWRPFYMPHSGVGLPQLNFDAPRLLAHCYLFPIDQELQTRTGGNFVRWMDDIDCGVPDQEAARNLLRALELVLNSIGVRLNSSKTTVLKAQDALAHFWVHENQALTILINGVKSATAGSPVWLALSGYALKRYFRRKERRGQWDKVFKRYLTLFGLLNSASLQHDAAKSLVDAPGLRGAVCRYFTLLGPSPGRLNYLDSFLRSGRVLDDASAFEVIRVLIAWRGQRKGKRKDAILNLVPVVARLGSETPGNTDLTVVGVSSAIWLLAKYGSPAELYAFLCKSEKVWTRSSWAARQVAAATPLLEKDAGKEVQRRIVQSGLLEAFRVLASCNQMMRLKGLDKQLQSYLLHPPTASHPYPLEKAIVARTVLMGLDDAGRKQLRKDLRKIVNDPCYEAIIRK